MFRMSVLPGREGLTLVSVQLTAPVQHHPLTGLFDDQGVDRAIGRPAHGS